MHPQQKRSNNQQQWFESKIKILGYFSNKLTDDTGEDTPNSQYVVDTCIRTMLAYRKNNPTFVPIKIHVESNVIAIIDNQQRGWIVTDFLAQPINLSEILKLKVYKLALGYNQLIVSTRENCLLVTWGSKKSISETNLAKYAFKNQKHKYSHLFDIFTILDTTKKDLFYFTNLKKVVDDNSLYALSNNQTDAIICYPLLQRIKLTNKVMGLSVGNHHKLCWDEGGRLFSWGCKCLALGHQNLPEEQQIKQPRLVSQLQGFVLKAYAANNYSLAITLQGKLYQWGVKSLGDKKEQFVFTPREIPLSPKQKPIDIKGKTDKFGLLTLSGNLYLWGNNILMYLSQQQDFDNPTSSSFISPTLVNLGHDFVLDFQISSGFIGVVVANKKLYDQSESQNKYWVNLKQNVKRVLRNSSNERVKTEGSQSRNNFKFGVSITKTSLSFRKFQDPVEFAVKNKQAKDKYLQCASDSDRLINYIMEPNRVNYDWENANSKPITFPYSNILTQHKTVNLTKRRNNYQLEQLSEEVAKNQQYIKVLVKGVNLLQTKNKMFRVGRSNNPDKLKQLMQSRNKVSYEQKLTNVLKKKQELHEQFIERVAQQAENNSFEQHMRRKHQYEQLKNKHKQIQICKSSLQKVMIKLFLIKLITKPIAEGRQIKIFHFSRNLRLHRLQKNIRNVFIKNRVRMQMKKLKQNQLFRFFLVTMAFQQYVKRFRLRKFEQQRKKATRQMMKSVVRQKLRMGVAACIFNIRKLQKFREWMVMVRTERKKCLKYMWKVYMLTMMKINSDHQNSAIFYLPKNIEELTFESIYQQKVAANPLLKLTNFLNKYSIFKIKATYFQKLVTLFSAQSKKLKDTQLQIAVYKGRKGRIKFLQEDEGQDRLNLMQTDILPYSLHYNLLIHPKNYDVTISQIVKMNEKWIRQERKIYEVHIDKILVDHQLQYLKKRRNHDIDLAIYIKKHYDSLAEKRWKYIIEYNKIQNTRIKQKREKQLRRLMKLVNAEALLNDDCIPEKQAIFDQIKKRVDAPQMPNSYIIFRVSDFKTLFRSYYEAVAVRIKEIRRTLH